MHRIVKLKEQFNFNTILLGVVVYFITRLVAQFDEVVTEQRLLSERVTKIEVMLAITTPINVHTNAYR